MTKCYLRTGDDYLQDAEFHPSIASAKAAFFDTARELWRYEQAIDASIHIADSIMSCHEYPDFTLRLGPKGGLVKEATK
jgi:hypothetical protein